MPELQSALAELASVAANCVATAPGSASRASDDALLEFQRELAASTRLLESAAASLAAEIARRSRRELGYDGLAQKRGARTPAGLVQAVTGASSAVAHRLVRVGTLVARNAGLYETPAEPWLSEVLAAAGSGDLSAEAVDAIRAGLGAPNDSIAPIPSPTPPAPSSPRRPPSRSRTLPRSPANCVTTLTQRASPCASSSCVTDDTSGWFPNPTG